MRRTGVLFALILPGLLGTGCIITLTRCDGGAHCKGGAPPEEDAGELPDECDGGCEVPPECTDRLEDGRCADGGPGEVADPPEPPPGCELLAITAATASAAVSDGPAEAAIDGDLQTRWSTDAPDASVTLDLGVPRIACAVNVAWFRGGARINHFSLSHSLDGVTFSPLASGDSSGAHTGLEPYRVPEVQARYLRLTVHGNSENGWASVSEVTVHGSDAQPSKLYGASGEEWDPRGRLPDFSWAGYRAGEVPIPDVPVSKNLKTDFGANGDGVTDDSAALQNAVNASDGGAVFIPPGRYVVTQVVRIRKSNVVLRGAGADPDGGTTLVFPKSLMEVNGLSTLPNPNHFSWGGGFIVVEPVGSDTRVTSVTAPALRGEKTLQVASAAGLSPGKWVFLRLRDDASASLRRHVHAGQYDPRSDPNDCSSEQLDMPVEIASVNGSTVTLRQPLRIDVRTEWTPELYAMATVSEVGIEKLRFEFNPSASYAGHHLEPGYNAIELRKNVVNSWIRDVEFAYADSGVFVAKSKWITLSNLRFTGRAGHHGVALTRTADALVTGFSFQKPADYVHELTATHQAHGNVFSLGGGNVAIDLDNHRDWPFENLFSGIGGQVLHGHAGDACAGPASGARTTFWNLERPAPAPTWGYIQTNVVGPLDPAVAQSFSATGAWYERLPKLFPPDLHTAQRAARLR